MGYKFFVHARWLFVCVFFLLTSALSAQDALFQVDGKKVNRNATISICEKTSVSFRNTNNNAYSLSWTFSGGSPASASGATATTSYSAAGTYKVYHRFAVQGVNYEDSVSIKVGNTYPVAKAAYTPTTIECGNTNFNFNSNGSTGNGLSYSWNFGDGVTDLGANPIHAFTKAIGNSGNQPYTVRLTVTNAEGCTDDETLNVSVRRVPDAAITSSVETTTFPSTNGITTFRNCDNQASFQFSFSNASSTITTNTQYVINWGDGSPQVTMANWPVSQPLTHTFSRGLTVMTVTVKNQDGCQTVRSYNVFVGSNPSGGFATEGNTTGLCAPSDVQFKINNTDNNGTGTRYTFTVNDGSDPVVMMHPPPASVTHKFERSSCGFLSIDGTNNAFYATLRIENPCEPPTTFNISPIMVSGKPNPVIITNPNVCVNNSISITHTGEYGVIASTASCNNTGKQVWTISPSTGYTISGGAFGSLKGEVLNSNGWDNGSVNLNTVFTQTGNYTVKLYMANSRCGIDSITQTICVRNPPTASFILDKKSVCQNGTVKITNTSPVGACGGERYNWAVRYIDPQNCGTSGSYSFISGTGNTAINPELSFAKPGAYIISLTVSANASTGCPSPVFTDTVYVKGKPRPVLANVGGACAGNALTPTAAVGNCYSATTPSYLWTFNGGTPASSTSAIPGAINYNTNGSFPISLKVGNECGDTTVTATVTIGPRPTANAGADVVTCSNQTVTIGSAAANGISYEWKPVIGLSFANRATTSVMLTYSGPAADTTYEYVVKAYTGTDCFNTDTVKVTVKRGPVVMVSPATASVCAGNATQLVASGADTYSWSPTAGLNTVNQATVMAGPTNTTTYTVKGTLTNGCSADASAVITVRSITQVDAGADVMACNNTSKVQLSGSPAGGSWRGNTNLTTTGVFDAKAAGNGVYKLYYDFSTNGCNGLDSLIVTVQNAPAVNAGNDTAFCAAGGSARLIGSPAGGTWGNSNIVQSNGTVNLTTAGTYQLVYTVGNGYCVNTDTVVVTIGNAVNNNTIGTTQGVCSGGIPAALLGGNAAAGSYTVSYQWQQSTDSASWSNIAGETGKDLVLAAHNATMFYQRLATTSLCGTGSPSNGVKIFIHPNALADFVPTPAKDCAPFTLTPAVINLNPLTDRNGTYQWLANGVSIGSGASFPGYTISNTDDTVTIRLITVSRFGCVDDTLDRVFITPPVATPSFLKDTIGGCGPLAVQFTNKTPEANRYQFLWNFGNGQTSTNVQPAPVIFATNPNYGDTTYYITMTTFNECKSIILKDSVLIRAKPKALFTPDIVEGCSPMKVNFTNTSRGSNASYEWDFGDGSARIPAALGTVQHTFNSGIKDTFYVRLFASNDCGTDTLRYAIVVNPNRIRLDFALNGNHKNVCMPDTILFINNTTGANSFEWDFGDGSTKLTTTKGIDSVYHVYNQTGNFTVTLFGTNGCSDTTTTETVTVERKPVVAFTATPNELCLGGTVQMNNTSEAGLSWAWNFGDGSSSNLMNPAKNYASTGSYTVSLTGTKVYPQGFGCAATATTNIVVNGPLGELQYQGGYTCLGDALKLETISNNTSQYRYYLGNGDSVISNTPIVNYTYKVPGTYLPSVMLVAGNCSKLLVGKDSIKVDRVQAGFKIAATYTCGNTSLLFTDTSNAYFGIVKREWDFGDGTTSSIANLAKNYTSPGNYTVRLRIKSVSGCIQVIDSLIKVEVRDKPVAAINSADNACTNNRISFTAASLAHDNIVGHSWSFGNNTTGTGSVASTVYNVVGNYTVRLICRTDFGCADTAYKTITVRQSPAVMASADIRICLGQSTQLNATGAANYQWSPAEGLSCNACISPVATPTATTQYIVTGTNGIGCSNIDSVRVQVVQPFSMNVTANDTLCIGQSSQLFASGANSYVWNPAVGLSSTTIPNPISKPATTTTYRVVGFDSYNCFTDTAFVTVAVGQYPTVDLGLGDSLVAGTTIEFKPSLTNGPFKSFIWTPTTGLDPANAQNPRATINKAITYILVAENIYGCKGTDTVSYQVFCSASDQVYIPNAFSPDGDGINDVFIVYGKGVSVEHFRVYNRWGQLVFDGGSNYQPNLAQYGWNGKVNGKPATQDVYVYSVQVKCSAGGSFTYKGNVSLLLVR